jgi:hypothetical protein
VKYLIGVEKRASDGEGKRFMETDLNMKELFQKGVLMRFDCI